MSEPSRYPFCSESSLLVAAPEIDYFINEIKEKRFFSVVRLQIEWWRTARVGLERMARKCLQEKYRHPEGHWLEILIERMAGNEEEKAGFLDEWSDEFLMAWQSKVSSSRGWTFEKFVIRGILSMICSDRPSNFHFSISDRANYCGEYPQPCGWNSEWVEQVVATASSSVEDLWLATVWRRYSLLGHMTRLFDELSDSKFVVIGPYFFHNFGKKLGLQDYTHTQIHHLHASRHIRDTFELVQSEHESHLKNHDRVIYLLSGGSPAIWLVNELHGTLENAVMIDVGRALDYFYRNDPLMKRVPKWMRGSWMYSKTSNTTPADESITTMSRKQKIRRKKAKSRKKKTKRPR